MSEITATAGTSVSRTPHGLFCIAVGMVLFACQDGLMKFLIGPYTVWQLLLVRSFVCAAVMIPAIVVLGGSHRLLTPYWRTHVARAALFAVGFSLFYGSFPYMTLASLTTIFFAAPLITAVLASVFLKETIGIYRIGALLVGFAGVVIAMKPGADTFQWVSLFPLMCATTYATSQILVRRLGDKESSLTTGAYTIVLAGVFILPLGWLVNVLTDVGTQAAHLSWQWSNFSFEGAPMLLLLGGIGMVAWTLLSRAYQVADASVIAPFEYAYIPIAATLGYLAFGEIPSVNTLIGMPLIVGSGLFLGYRELLSARRAKTPAPTAEASFIPATPPPPTTHPESGV